MGWQKEKEIADYETAKLEAAERGGMAMEDRLFEAREAAIEIITALDWTTHPDADAIEAIRADLPCSTVEAKEYLEEICLSNQVECRSESGMHAEPWDRWLTKWKWYRKTPVS
jgi:hypothetical protein